MPHQSRISTVMSRLVMAISLIAAGCAAPAANDPAAADQVRSAMSAYIASVKVGADSMATFFADSGVLLEPGMSPVIGSKAIAEFMVSQFKQIDVRSVGGVVQAVDVTGDVATLWGTYHETIAPRAGGEATAYAGRLVTSWKKGRDGRWRIALMMTQPDPAPQMTPPVATATKK